MELLEPRAAIELVRREVGRSLAEALLKESQKVSLSDLHGRLIAETIRAPMPLPRFPRATLDGYAVSLQDVMGASRERPSVLRLRERAKVGEVSAALGAGECVYVDTGSAVPPGTEAVVAAESAEERGELVAIFEEPSLGDGIALPSTDVSSGDIVIHRGQAATPLAAAALASLGLSHVTASRRARVAVLSIGRELVEAGSPLPSGKVYDANRHYVISLMSSIGYEVLDLGIAEDTEEGIEGALKRAAGADLIVTSGSTSLGTGDLLPKVLRRVGRLLVRGLRIKPGKPTIVGLLGKSLLIGLPGNPRAAVNVMSSFVMDLLDSLGLPSRPEPRDAEVLLAASLKLDPRRRLYVPLATVASGKGSLGYPVAVESYAIASLPKADSFATVESGKTVPALAMIRATRQRSPEESIVSLVDTKLIDLERYGARVIYATGKERFETARLLKGSGTLVVSSSLKGQLGEPLEEAEREVLLVKRSDCRLAAVYDLYADLYPGRKLEVPRAETAKILYELSYVDCALLPQEYSPGGNETSVTREKVFLARL
ncbi:MAG: molybdopterin molybdotransferase MoeA [Acidilobaceae archaeon]|nr:molybdopterin molybdotransferase MoeA [Acidilobaceae archaeon]